MEVQITKSSVRDSFTAPSSDGLTAPTGKAFDGWKDTLVKQFMPRGLMFPYSRWIDRTMGK